MTGLQPSPEEVESLVQRASAETYSRWVDQLLASPHYGERWGRHWLDLARYAESDGFEHDAILHLLGLDHERLTYPHNGREQRLTDVAGSVIRRALRHDA